MVLVDKKAIPSLEGLSKEEFDTEMERRFAEMKAGKTIPIEMVAKMMQEKYVQCRLQKV